MLLIDRKNLRMVILLNCVVLFSALMLFDVYYVAGDEFYFNLIMSGAEGQGYREYTAFINIILSKMFVVLYDVVPGLNWYLIVSLIFSFISLVSITYCIFNIGDKKIVLIYCILLFCLLGKYAYLEFSFTYNAYLYCAAGMLLIVDLCERNLFSYKGQLIIAIILILMGSMLRIFSLYAITPIFAVLLLIMIFKYKKRLSNIIVFGSVVLIAILLNQYNTMSYANNKEWDEYQEYNSIRSSILDYELIDYKENKDSYEKIGLNEIDYEMVKSWMLEDYNVFDLNMMKELQEFRKKSDVNLSEFFGIHNFEIMVIFFVICMMLFLEKKYLVEIIGVFVIIILEYGYLLFIIQRCNFRAVFGIWVALFLIISYRVLNNVRFDTIKNNKKGKIVLVVFCVICGISILDWKILDKVNIYSMQNEYEEMLEYIGDNKENLYLAEMWTMDEISKNTDPMYKLNYSSMENLYVTGGCYLRNPRTNSILEKYNVLNPIPSLIENESVYLIAKYHTDLISNFLMKKYEIGVGYEKIKDFGDIGIYRYYKDDDLKIVKTGDFYEDKWFGIEGNIAVYNKEKEQNNMIINYSSNEYMDGAIIKVIFSKHNIKEFEVSAGNHNIIINLENIDDVNFEITIDRSFNPNKLGESSDNRNLSVLIENITLEN